MSDAEVLRFFARFRSEIEARPATQRSSGREFNAAVLGALDELTEWTAEEVAGLERSSEQ